MLWFERISRDLIRFHRIHIKLEITCEFIWDVRINIIGFFFFFIRSQIKSTRSQKEFRRIPKDSIGFPSNAKGFQKKDFHYISKEFKEFPLNLQGFGYGNSQDSNEFQGFDWYCMKLHGISIEFQRCSVELRMTYTGFHRTTSECRRSFNVISKDFMRFQWNLKGFQGGSNKVRRLSVEFQQGFCWMCNAFYWVPKVFKRLLMNSEDFQRMPLIFQWFSFDSKAYTLNFIEVQRFSIQFQNRFGWVYYVSTWIYLAVHLFSRDFH